MPILKYFLIFYLFIFFCRFLNVFNSFWGIVIVFFGLPACLCDAFVVIGVYLFLVLFFLCVGFDLDYLLLPIFTWNCLSCSVRKDKWVRVAFLTILWPLFSVECKEICQFTFWDLVLPSFIWALFVWTSIVLVLLNLDSVPVVSPQSEELAGWFWVCITCTSPRYLLQGPHPLAHIFSLGFEKF